jgi:hypothetical protein
MEEMTMTKKQRPASFVFRFEFAPSSPEATEAQARALRAALGSCPFPVVKKDLNYRPQARLDPA